MLEFPEARRGARSSSSPLRSVAGAQLMGHRSFHISSYRHVLRYEYLLDQRRGDETGEYEAVTLVARSKSRRSAGTSPEDAMID